MSVRLPGLEGGLSDWAAERCADRVGPLNDAERINGGNVSHVFRVRGQRGTLILKVRGSRHARIPQFRTDPALVGVEARALRLFRDRLPDEIPAVMAVNPPGGELILEDLGSVTLAQTWAAEGVTEADAAHLGNLAGRLHRATAGLAGELRAEGDQAARAHLVGYCLRDLGVPALIAAVERSLSEPGQIVHGDLAPKNVLVRPGGGLAMCDLEAAHRGSAVLDLAYALAHVLLHGPAEAVVKRALADAFLGAHAAVADAQASGDELVPCVVGILLYRLRNRQVPYDLALPLDARRAPAERLMSLMERPGASLTNVCRALTGPDRPVLLRPRQAADGRILVPGPTGTSVVHADLLTSDHRAFAVRAGRGTREVVPGVTLAVDTVELEGDRFTNLYELRAAGDGLRLVAWSDTSGAFLRDLVGRPGTIAAFTGSFSFISDDPSYAPAEPCFDLCVRDGRVVSLPTCDKPALLVSGGGPVIRPVRAAGRIRIGGRELEWVGSKSHATGPGAVVAYSAANCRIRYALAARTWFHRHVSRAENVTPPDATATDAVVMRTDAGLVIDQVHRGGGADLFAGAFVLRFRAPVPPEVRPGAAVEVMTVDDLHCRGLSCALSVGPSVADAACGETAGYDAFLGNDPFRADGCYARTIISVEERSVTLQVFDGAPLAPEFRGPTPAEVRAVLCDRRGDPDRAFHLDGGGSAKLAIAVRGGGEPLVLGSLHYLRWPRAGEEFAWQGLRGRPLHSAICITRSDVSDD